MPKERHISNPRPVYAENSPKKGSKQFKMGTSNTGIVLEVNKKGIKINGYYAGKDVIFSIFHKPVFIRWDEFDKIKNILSKPKKRHKEILDDDIPDQEYFDTLPIVELNDRQFYIDSKRCERREVENTNKVIKF
jgi:hypothetical protein